MIGRLLAAWHTWRATRRYAGKDLEGAKDALDRALKACPDLPQADQYLGVLALKRGRLKEAQEHLLKAVGRGGDPFVVGQGLGAIELLRKRFGEAEKRFKEAFEAFPVAYEIGYHVGLCRQLAGDEKGSVGEFARLLAREDGPLFIRLKGIGARK